MTSEYFVVRAEIGDCILIMQEGGGAVGFGGGHETF